MEGASTGRWRIDRRTALALGAGAFALAGQPLAACARSAAPVGLVIDTRFRAARVAAVPPAAWLHRIDGDVTALWYDRLDLAWRDPEAGAVAGVTGSDALFVLEHLAWDRRRRVVLRQELRDGGGPVPLVRWLIAPRNPA